MSKNTPSRPSGPTSKLPESSDSDSEELEDLEEESQVLTIQSDQIKHYRKCNLILDTSSAYLDGSGLGSGKTIIALALAIKRELSLFVTCPVSVQPNWRKQACKYGVGVAEIISYDSLSSRVGSVIKHPWLKRHDYLPEGSKKWKTTFTVTKAFRKLVKQGILLVIDECHNIKNGSTVRFNAVTTLTHYIHRSGGQSRVALLSGTVIDKTKFVQNIVQALGLTNGPLYDNKKKALEVYDGFAEYIAACRAISDAKTTKVLEQSEYPPTSQSGADTLCADLLVAVVREQYVSCMPNFKRLMPVEYRNCSYETDAETHNKMAKIVEELKKETNFKDGAVSNVKLGNVTTMLRSYEEYSIPIFARQAIEHLEAGPKFKVVICLNFVETSLHILRELLSGMGYGLYFNEYKSDYSLIITGDCTEAQREETIELFAQSKARILIMQVRAGGVGINLHPLNAGEDTLMLISPSYAIISMIQAAGRVDRKGAAARVEVRVVYGCREASCKAIQDALAEKAAALQLVLDDEFVNNISYPHNYGASTISIKDACWEELQEKLKTIQADV